jgi:ElaB/YqjD/DUF883 family membrane-anchored ribosome-binding protein
MRTTRGILQIFTVAVFATGLISLTGACQKQGDLERLGGKTDRAIEEAGEAVEDTADKVKEGVEDAADKVKEGVEDAADKVKEAVPNGPVKATPKPE